jgi:Fur family transcriptional regulator, zinc uptake regulator
MTTMPRAIFPAPDHDHERCASAGIAHAEADCAARAQRLTPMRRQVLETLLASHKPLGAYEIIERLAEKNRPAPITIYRALDFLREMASSIASKAVTPSWPAYTITATATSSFF